MKILAIIGTGRKKGTVVRLCESLLEGARASGHHTKIINLHDYDIKNCSGCWKCVNSQCPIQDDFQGVFHEVLDADVIVLGAPCYWSNVPGVMKTFFDRHTGYAMQKPQNANTFFEMSTKNKFLVMAKELKNLGPMMNIRNKKFILLSAMTLPSPIAHISGDYKGLIKPVKQYTKKMKGTLIRKLVFTDTLLQFKIQ